MVPTGPPGADPKPSWSSTKARTWNTMGAERQSDPMPASAYLSIGRGRVDRRNEQAQRGQGEPGSATSGSPAEREEPASGRPLP